jgi:hypothetical protein
MAQGYSTDLDANWPLVIGVGLIVAVVFYALYIVEQQLTPISTTTGALSNFINGILNFFTPSSTNSTDPNDIGTSSPSGSVFSGISSWWNELTSGTYIPYGANDSDQ